MFLGAAPWIPIRLLERYTIMSSKPVELVDRYVVDSLPLPCDQSPSTLPTLDFETQTCLERFPSERQSPATVAMAGDLAVPSNAPVASFYSRVSAVRASADAIPILVNGVYHLFHLTTPPNTRHHPPRLRSSWYRMRSKDLTRWTRDKGPSISPGGVCSDPDADGAWTGAAVLGRDGRMNIFYTGYNLSENGKQVILRTTSSSQNGDDFGCPGKQISILGETRNILEDIDFRDPYVFWNDAESTHWMIVATRLKDGPYWSRGCIALLRSSNLEDWEMAPEPLYQPNDMFCPECPEIFTLGNGKWYLVYSRFHAPDAGTVYRIADSPYGPFRIPRDGSHGRLDGRRWYAAKSCPEANDPSRRISFGWIGDYVEKEQKWLWGGDLAVPREISADEAGNLRMYPVAGALALFEATSTRMPHPENVELTALGSSTFEVVKGLPAAQDVLIKFSVQTMDAHSFGLVFHMDGTMKGFQLRFTKICGRYTVTLLTDFPPLDDFWADQYNLHLPRAVDGPELGRHEHVELTEGILVVLKDRTLEAFFGGRALTYRLPEPPKKEGFRRLAYFVEDGSIRLTSFSIGAGGMTAQMGGS